MLTDVVMPGMKADVIAERLLRLKPNMKVLFTSGHSVGSDASAGAAVRAAAFLQKPYRPDELARKLRELLDEP